MKKIKKISYFIIALFLITLIKVTSALPEIENNCWHVTGKCDKNMWTDGHITYECWNKEEWHYCK